MVRPESTCIDAFQKLEQLLLDIETKDIISIPPERELAKRFGVSRTTIRKVITRAIEQNLLRKESRSYVVYNNKQIKPAFKIGFVAHGIGMPGNRVWARVLHYLSLLGQSRAISVEPILFNQNKPEEDTAKRQIQSCKALVLTGSQAHEFAGSEEVKGKPAIFTDECVEGKPHHLVCLDNYAVGCKAAEYLLGAGCKNVLFVGRRANDPYTPFVKRMQGFADRLKGQQVTFACEYATPPNMAGKGWVYTLERLAPRVVGKGYDGIFVFSDEGLGAFISSLSALGSLPTMITVFGNGDLNEKGLPVAFIDHAEAAMAAGILDALESCFEKNLNERIIRYVRPMLHPCISNE
jgi:hypothetical protein